MRPTADSKGVAQPGIPTVKRPESVRVWLLGRFKVSVGLRTIDEGAWRLRKAASLVKLLALAPGHRLQREQVIHLLWPDLRKKAASNNLRQTLHAARRILGPDAASRYLASEEGSLVLCPEGRHLRVDVDVFEEAAAIARRSRDPAAHRAALDLYTDELLPDDRYEEWAQDRREQLRRLYFELLLELTELYEERGEYGTAVEACRRMIVEEPTNEEAHAGLMHLYALSGRQSQALAQYERLRETLSRELGTEPGQPARRMRDEIASGRLPSTRPAAPPPSEKPIDAGKHNLPAARTNFVGREREMVEVKRTLSMTGLLTLTGTGGCGKTRLALQVARILVGVYEDGVWIAELAPVSDGVLVTQVVAKALGVRELPGRSLTDTLVDALKEKRMLLLLDNCEHLVDASASLADTLLGSCPYLKILATSREPMGVAGEAIWRVPSLSAPSTDRPPTTGELTRYDAVRLFLDRARFRLPDFDLTPGNAPAVAALCGGLEGIPLAIELATARMGVLAVEEVAGRLGDSLGLLGAGPRTAAPRQRTMRATLEWSYGPLSGSERKLFQRLSVFAGGWTLEAVEAVGSNGIDQADVLDLLGRLVDKSLVVADTTASGGTRYRMLEPIRQYGREKLKEGPESAAVHRRHAAFFLAMAEKGELELKGAQQEAWLARLEGEHDNLRGALSWTLEREEEQLSLRFCAALGEFWHMRGHLSEGKRWFEAALAKGDAPSVARVRALTKACWIAWEQTDFERAMALGEEGLELARALGDEEGAAATLFNLGITVMSQGDLNRATVLFEESLSLFRKSADKWGLARSLLSLGLVAMLREDYGRARELMEDGLAVSRESGNIYDSSMALNQLALLALVQVDYERAQALCEESLELSRQPGMMHHIAFALHTSAAVAGSRGQPVRSARLWGAAEALREAIGTAFSPMELRVYEPYIAAARVHVEEAVWEAAWQEGRAMSAEEAVEYVLSKEEVAPPTPPGHEQRVKEERTPLSRREQEVASLVARGLTNRQVATELSISEHTVANHIARILRKRGLGSRSQITAWIVEQRTLS